MVRWSSSTEYIVPIRIEKEINGLWFQKYRKLDKTVLKKIAKQNSLPERLITSMQVAYLRDKNLFGYQNAKRMSSKIQSDYKNKVNILILSDKYKVSPLTIMRLILDISLNTKTIAKLNLYDKQQVQLAAKHDLISSIDNSKVLANSQAFEVHIATILTKNDIGFYTEDQQKKNN